MMKTAKETIESAAGRLAEHNAQAEPNILEILLFPNEEEIRLVEVDPTCMPSEKEVVVFYFAPDIVENMPFPSGIGMVLPEEKGKLKLPDDWGSWNDARSIWRRGNLR